MYNYFFWVLAHLSLFINALFGGQPYESVCARAWRIRKDTTKNSLARLWAWCTIVLTELFEHRHCYKAYRCHQAVMKGFRQYK